MLTPNEQNLQNAIDTGAQLNPPPAPQAVSSLLILDSAYVGSRDLWWVDSLSATKGYSIYRAFDYPTNWSLLNDIPWPGHFYRDSTVITQKTVTIQPSDFLDAGEFGKWGFKLPETPYSKQVKGRPVVATSPDDVTVLLDGKPYRPVMVEGIDRSVWMKMDNTLPEGGAVSALAIVNDGVVWQADYSGVQKWQAVFNVLTNYVDIYTTLTRTYYCYSDDTEVMTKDGWKLFKDCTEDDYFATRKIQTKEFEWQKATGFFKARYDGNLTHFKGQSTDILVTPNHRMLVNSLPDGVSSRNRPKKRKEHVIEAKDLASHATSMTGIATTSRWEGEEIQQVVFEPPDNQSNKKARRIVLPGDDFCALLGMYLAEGCLTGCGKGFAICQPDGDKRGTRKLYLELLQKHFWVKEYPWGLEVKSMSLRTYLKQFGRSWEKFLPEILRNTSPRQLEIFWKFYYMGDGAAAGDSGSSQVAYTVSKRLSDHLVEIIQKMGSSSSFSTNPSGTYEIEGRVGPTREGYFVTRHARKSGYTANWKTSEVEYHSMVFCVSVPNMFLYVRRNGKHCWSGNTIVPVGDTGEVHEPGAPGTPIVNTQEVDQLDYMQAAMVRYNEWGFEMFGEPALVMFRKTRGVPCGCKGTGLGQPRTGCPSCFEVGYVGGYYGPYDIVYIDPDAGTTRELDEGGIKVTREAKSYLTRTPIVQDGDLIIRRNGERLVVNGVTYKSPRGVILQQDFNVTLLNRGDTRYLIPINTGRPTIFDPVVSENPLNGKGNSEPITEARTEPDKQWENPNPQPGRSISFGKIQR